jgi:hypothetical protein
MIKPLAIDLIRCDGGTQMRAELSVDVYMDYRDKILAGVEFPPLDVFFDGSEYWLADGFHRFYGHREAKKASVKCNVHNGTVRDAILFAVGANDDHGLKRSPQDKKNSVFALLGDKEWGKRSSNWIAEKCRISHNTVEAYRKDFANLSNDKLSEPEPRVGKDGKARKAPTKSAIKSQASVTGSDTKTSVAAPPDSLPSVGTVNRTDSGSQGDGDAGECPKGGPHDFLEGACIKCCEPDGSIPEVVPMEGGDSFDPANIEAHSKSFAAAFAAKVKQHNLEIERYARRVSDSFEAQIPLGAWLDDSRVGMARDSINAAVATLRQAKAHDKPCPKCDGKGENTGKPCKSCRGVGFMPKVSYEMAGGK